MMSIGQRIRTIRTLHGLSSSALARAAGVSRGLISQIELDRANPSIDTLRKIAAALDSPIAAFFDDDKPQAGMVVRRDERKTLRVPRSGLTYELLTPDLNRQIEFILIELEPGEGGSRTPFGHPGEEAALILEGQVHVWIGEEEHVLEAGDSISFNSGLQHRVANHGDTKAVLVSAITPPSF
jgi:transcriptional regulator with XRE-family HTH domain